jgi:bifunctional DNA-binding transcriptional regulator/antitoxin component of YhaV-PrlF toxin-antitoxin module
MEPIAIKPVKGNYLTAVPKKALDCIGVKAGDEICYYVDTQNRSITIKPKAEAQV